MLGAVNFGHDQMQTVIDVIIALAERCAKEPRDVPAPAHEVGQVKEKLLAGGILDKFSEAYTEVDKQARQGKIAAVREGAVASLTDEEKRSEEHPSELQSLMRIPYAVFCLKKKTLHQHQRYQ